jgi:hypothetical protein
MCSGKYLRLLEPVTSLNQQYLYFSSAKYLPDRNKQNVNEILNSEDYRVSQSLMLQDDVKGNNSNSSDKKRGSFRLPFTVYRPHFLKVPHKLFIFIRMYT